MDRCFASVDYFSVLDVKPSATDDDIRTAFRKLALVHHPDKATYDKEEAKRKFQSIVEAYEVLKDPDLRARFLRVRERGSSAGSRFAGSSSSGAPAPRRTSSGAGSSSIAGLRRAGMQAMRQQEREVQEAKEQEFAAAQRTELRKYTELKDAIKSKLLIEAGPDADASWDEWKKQIGAMWLNASWEQHLPEHSSDDMKARILRDVRNDLKEQKVRDEQAECERREREAAVAGVAMGDKLSATDGRIPVTTTGDGGAPMAKRKARSSEGYADAEYAQPPPWSTKASTAASRGVKLGYLELIEALQGLGYSPNAAESAARLTDSLDAAVAHIKRSGGA